MAYRMLELEAVLLGQLYTAYSREELVRIGYRTGDNMLLVATGRLPMGDGSRRLNEVYLSQVARAQRWIGCYHQRRCGWEMLSVGRFWRGGAAAVTVVLLLGAGCGSPDARAARDLANTVKIEGYRKLGDQRKGETTLLYFVGPTGVDLREAVMARNWLPGPPPPGLPEVGAFKWVLAGSANTEDHRCELAVSTLRPGFENVAIRLDDEQKQDLAAGSITYVEIACVCAGAP